MSKIEKLDFGQKLFIHLFLYVIFVFISIVNTVIINQTTGETILIFLSIILMTYHLEYLNALNIKKIVGVLLLIVSYAIIYYTSQTIVVTLGSELTYGFELLEIFIFIPLLIVYCFITVNLTNHSFSKINYIFIVYTFVYCLIKLLQVSNLMYSYTISIIVSILYHFVIFFKRQLIK